MDWAELRAAIMAEPPGDGELVYIGRHGADYTWSLLSGGAVSPHGGTEAAPQAWIYYSGPWPGDGLHPDREQAFFDDLRAELESMTGDFDRCRRPLDQPWPHGH